MKAIYILSVLLLMMLPILSRFATSEGAAQHVEPIQKIRVEQNDCTRGIRCPRGHYCDPGLRQCLPR
uniref:U-scoloptoxin(04)-Ssd2a n=2 Tax=Scolopendra TaxID=41364 RepID=TX42A_SCODE|nr:RecName: Full=U-scoloptoxin(04)-Ssd2a; Short=U-SLPTX(04)-Ssd2a; AltName: Full=Toxin SSD416; Flags: Precursor [Scolopendra dehaani]P0DPX3.1 RecName: Full=U-scoloptoxin(04)-Sm2a; Short=U-SLPTX(04)-Sm2a; Flags: Precursor [Scolopendra morsitans]